MGGANNIQVVVRVRPFIYTELDRGDENAVQIVTEKFLRVGLGKETSEFVVDRTYSEEKNDEVYAGIARDCVSHAFAGYNSTVFAYGQTGSGKTHTIMGTDDDPGIIPRLSRDLFAEVEARGNCSVLVEYVEIYGTQEKLGDLLADPGSNRSMRVKMAGRGTFIVDGLTRYTPSSTEEMMLFVKAGSQRRATSATAMNDQSSRSHALFTITVEQLIKDDHGGESRRESQIKLVDLAGSENTAKSKATGKRMEEATAINSALSSLKRVLNALVKKETHIPFRDSALTKLLANSLGGNSRTTMVANISPSSYNLVETKNTCVWACKARKIVNKPVVNDRNEMKRIQNLQEEILALKKRMAAGGGGLSELEREKLREQVAERERELEIEQELRKERERQLAEFREETRKRLATLELQYQESQEQLGDARTTWKALSSNLAAAKREIEVQEIEIGRLKKILTESETWGMRLRIEDVERREKDIGTIEHVLRDVAEREARAVALEEELELRSASISSRERDVSKREESVQRREMAIARNELELAKLQREEDHSTFITLTHPVTLNSGGGTNKGAKAGRGQQCNVVTRPLLPIDRGLPGVATAAGLTAKRIAGLNLGQPTSLVVSRGRANARGMG